MNKQQLFTGKAAHVPNWFFVATAMLFLMACNRHPGPSTPNQPISIDAANLYDQFYENSANSQQLYTGKTIVITGVINHIKEDDRGTGISLTTSFLGKYVRCYLREDAEVHFSKEELAKTENNGKYWAKGLSVKLQGTFIGVNNSNVFFGNCKQVQ